ncbi:MAG: hypothetical protein WB919_07850 [Candidatus Sulfotelmatobacter sp.]
MTNSGFGNPTPQFGTAEYAGSPGVDHCQFCRQPIAGQYYRAHEAIACSACAQQMRGKLARDSHAAFVRALLFGIGAAVAGLVLYATFAIATGIVIGYASLAVGWMIGKAMMKGSNGVGGGRYQIAAVLLTYAAVSLAAVPIWIHYAGKQTRSAQSQRAQHTPEPPQDLSAEQRQLEREFGKQRPLPKPAQANPNASAGSAEPSPPATPEGQMSPSAQVPGKQQVSRSEAIVRLALLGLFSPFVEAWAGGFSFGLLIDLVILFVGMQFAWRMTAGKAVEIFGPFDPILRPPA